MGLHVELQKGVDELVALFPDVLPTSATLSLYAPDKTTAEVSPSVSLVSINTTVVGVGQTPDVVDVAAATNIVVDEEVWYVSASGWSCKARVAALDGTRITFESPLLGTPAVGDAVKGLRLSATVPGANTSARGKGYKLHWTVTSASGAPRVYTRQAAVCTTKFRAPATPDDAVRLAADISPGWARAQTSGRWRRLAERATEDVRLLLEGEEDWPWLVGDHEAFKSAGEIALRIRLAELGIVPQGYDAATYRKDYEAKLEPEVRKAVAGVIVDKNENDVEDPAERKARSTIHIRRE